MLHHVYIECIPLILFSDPSYYLLAVLVPYFLHVYNYAVIGLLQPVGWVFEVVPNPQLCRLIV